ncbi:hypothetical protein MJO29_008652 [Puccinia striiformis f. sp. tritici]|nr:hypothetical protein MJO29_008652 [Puccinia striiformis f. sp. tritici]
MEKKVGLMLKSTAKDDANGPKKELKSAIMLKHLLALVDILSGGPEEDVAILDLAIIAFWGMARLGELTYTNRTGVVATGPQWGDASVSQDLKSAIIVLRGAKTAKPGELQYIRLTAMAHGLCPVLAVKRRINSCCRRGDSLFGFATPEG